MIQLFSDDLPTGARVSLATQNAGSLEMFAAAPAIVDVTQFGIVGGVTDNYPALLRLQAALLAEPATAWTVVFPPGVYCSSRPYWLRSIKYLRISAYGAQFKNIANLVAPSAFAADNSPIQVNSTLFLDYTSDTLGSASYNLGFAFASANVGDTTLTLVNAADAANFAAGDRVLLYGFCKQAVSFPPNPRTWEYAVVQSVGIGVLNLAVAIVSDYDDRWYDFATPSGGAPRVVNLDRSTGLGYTHGEVLIWEGGEAIAQTGPGAMDLGSALFSDYKTCVVRDFKAHDTVMSILELGRFIDCELGACIPDKICRKLDLLRSKAAPITEATGIDQFHIAESEIAGANDWSPPNAYIENCRIGPNPGACVNVSPLFCCHGIRFQNCQFDASLLGDPEVDLDNGWVNFGATYTLTVASVSSATKILVSIANDADAQGVLAPLDVGFVLRSQTDASRFGIVSAIYQQDATHLAIEAEFSAAPAPAEVYEWESVRFKELGANCRSVNTAKLFRPVAFDFSTNGSDVVRFGKVKHFVVAFEDLRRPASGAAAPTDVFPTYGYLRRITVTVTKAYTGGGAGPELRLQDQDAATVLQSIDVTELGERTVDFFSIAGAAGSDVLAATTADVIRHLGIRCIESGGFFWDYASREELPDFVVELEVVTDA
jgi:hypothetical protein